MKQVSSIEALRNARAGLKGRIGFVPTMGNLHAGHMSLVDAARRQCDAVVVSIFVNPMQFDEPADLAAYPRTLDDDRARLIDAGVELLFYPGVDDIYPHAPEAQTRVEVPGLGDILEGAFRPGHFTGVATVVSKLFNLVQPDAAFFGKKDYQQLKLIRKMTDDLAMPVEIIGLETRRELDGLAMSSRNARLTPPQREIAPRLLQTLQSLAGRILSGERKYPELQAAAEQMLQGVGFEPEYVRICRARDLQPATDQDQDLVILVAARLGETRLIDNLEVLIE